MTNIYYKNDFLLRLRFEDMAGVELAPPQCDWEAQFATSAYTASYMVMHVSGTFVRCRRDKDTIIVPFDNHGLTTGDLGITFTANIPAKGYPDGKAHICVKESTGIRLADNHNCSASVSSITTVTIRLPLFASDLINEPSQPDDPKEPTNPDNPDNPGSSGCDCEPTESLTEDDINNIINEVVNGH